MKNRTFLSAQWRNLLMLNYEVSPEVLIPHLPPATELDLWQGKALVSMVGFRFLETKVLGVNWPWHVNFEEVNLRFYVRHFDGQQWKRGVVFVSEIVPQTTIAVIANTLYHERYQSMPMRHSVTPLDSENTTIRYEWKYKGRWNALGAVVANTLRSMTPDSAEAFILEHYWGYNKLNDHTTHEYQVEHVPWQIADVRDAFLDADVAGLYGHAFLPFLSQPPYSVCYADGSPVAVRIAGKLRC
ncbi:YqjF family protein [Spirosoma areae]